MDARQPKRHRELVTRCVALAVALGAFFALAHFAERPEHLRLDDWLLHALRTDAGKPIGPKWLEGAMRDVTALGSTVVLVTLSAAAGGWLALRGRFGAAALVWVSGLSGHALNTWLKHEYGRVRPELTLRLVEIDSPSFPSGHATSSAIAYLMLALVAAQGRTRRERVYLTAISSALVFAVGATRVYLGVHYPTDVIAGWLVGAVWTALCFTVARLLQRRGVGGPARW